MSLNTVCDFFNIEYRGRQGISQLVSKIPKKIRSKKANPHTLGWRDVYTVVEMKRGPKDKGSWPPLRMFTVRVATTDVAEIGDKKLFEPCRDPSPPVDAEEDSQAKGSVSTKSGRGRKRTASVAGIKGGTSGNKSKRARQQNSERNTGEPESKRSPQQKSGKNTRKSLAIQNGIYAAEKFSDSLSVSHVLNLLVQDDYLWISWIDREGVIFSSGFSFFANLPLTLVLLLTLQRFGRRQWGYISELTSRDRAVSLYPVNADGSLGRGEVDINFYLNDKIHSGWSLLGRATTVVGASDKAKDSRAHAEEEPSGVRNGDEADERDISGSYEDHCLDLDEVDADEQSHENSPNETSSDLSSTGDEEVINAEGVDDEDKQEGGEDEKENKDNQGALNQLHDLVLKVFWPEASRHEEWKIISHAQTLGDVDKFIGGHIPQAKYARDLSHYSTRHIRDFLGLKTAPRTLRLMVMPRLYPLYDLGGEALWNAFWECFVCHYRLWVNGIHHGDISFNNLMYYVTPQTNAPRGVLNDYDLASWAGKETVNNGRTGTIPFMALDLLNGGLEACVPRLYRHDAESFTWVLAYLSVVTIERKHKGGSAKFSWPPEMDAWFEENRVTHRSSKQSLGMQYGDEVPVPEHYARYTTTIRQLITYWVNRYASSSMEAKRGAAMPGDEDATATLKVLIAKMGKFEGDAPDVFAGVKALLHGAVDVPTAPVV
ncbi:hypothetical protein BDM02DRAFT_2526506 [Thelephora ganbajun]|uniref:Uncharacterized protein n=1 Tax=Thelephora ganbajun TaxID=370292 RepID=A0ACB6ZD91_THEGA|nr:hypothetical protein BDM02DRAFT_2526506 [Thelephora ganbajun]